MQLNLSTPICQTGYGLTGLNLLKALDEARHEVTLFPIGELQPTREYETVVTQSIARQATCNPDAPGVCLKEVLFPAEPVSRKHRSVYTIFELDRLTPEELRYLSSLDAVFVCTTWARNVLLGQGIPSERVKIVPLGVDHAVFDHARPPAPLSSRETIFLSMGKFELRKGQDLLLEGFNRAFEPGDAVRLLVHGWNYMFDEAYNRFWIQCFKESKMGARISVIEKPFESHREVAEFMAQADCGVFPSRAEGWNLELLEMMALGKTVVASNYAGHTEFATPANCLLIHISALEKAQDGVKFRGQGCWARFGADELEQLVVHLRTVHQRKQDGTLRQNVAGIETALRFTWRHSAQRLVTQLP